MKLLAVALVIQITQPNVHGLQAFIQHDIADITNDTTISAYEDEEAKIRSKASGYVESSDNDSAEEGGSNITGVDPVVSEERDSLPTLESDPCIAIISDAKAEVRPQLVLPCACAWNL